MKTFRLSFILLVLCLVVQHANSQNDFEFPGVWYDNFARTGTSSSQAYALAEDFQGHVWLAQSKFHSTNNSELDQLIRFDGRNWHNEDPGFNDRVEHIAFDSQGNLYAAGRFTEIDGISANHIAMFDGNTWQALGEGISAILAFRDVTVGSLFIDDNDNVFIGGEFEQAGDKASTNIAMWDGSAWNTFGDHIDYQDPVVGIERIGNKLWLAVPTSSSSVPYGIYRYNLNANAWMENLPNNTFDRSSIVHIEYDGNNRVYLAGQDTANNDDIAFGYLDTNDLSLTKLDIPINYRADTKFAKIDSEGNVYLVGFFDGFQGSHPDFRSKTVIKWNDTDGYEFLPDVEGHRMNTAPNTPLYPTLSNAFVTSTNELYLCGRIGLAGGDMAYNIAKWDGNNWRSLGNGIGRSIISKIQAGRVNDISSNSDNEILVAGDRIFGGKVLNSVGKWNKTNESWEGLGNGLQNTINTITEDSDGNILAGGSFRESNFSEGGTNLNRIAQFTNASWQPMDEGFNDEVYVIYADEDYIIAGGRFGNPFGLSIWNKNTQIWESIQGTGTSVYDIKKGPDGKIYIAGRFRFIQGEEEFFNIVAWDGSNFHQVGNGISSTIYAIEFLSNGNLIAGGSFSTNRANGRLNAIAELKSDNEWYPLGEGLDDDVLAITISKEGAIIVGGEFNASGDKTVKYMAAWDGTEWVGFENGPNGLVRTLHRDNDGLIWIGGSFSMVGETTAQGITYWDGDLPEPEEAYLLLEIVGEGTVSPGYDSDFAFEIGQQISIEATPSEGFVFGKFILEEQDYLDNPIDITMNSTVRLVVVFEEESLGTNNNLESHQLSIYPNPASEIVHIDVDEQLKLEKISVYSALGQLVKVERNNKVDVSNLKSGYYVFEIHTKQGKMTKTIVVK
jgi:hypothetical protein